jgi:hypothetical protein
MAKLSFPIDFAHRNRSSAFLRSPQIGVLILSLLMGSVGRAQTAGPNKTVESIAPSGPRLVWKYHTGG